MLRLCKDCIHCGIINYYENHNLTKCTRVKTVSPVTGEEQSTLIYAEVERNSILDTACGIHAQFFELKE